MKIYIYSSLFAVLAICKSVYAQETILDSSYLSIIKQGIHQIHIDEFDEAFKSFKILIDAYPQHPAGYFGTATVYHTIMRNYRTTIYEAEFDSLLDLAVDIGVKAIRKHRKDQLAHLSLAGARGFRGLHKLRKRDWIGAFIDGREGVLILQRVVAMEPEFYDAYFGLGAYHYWRSAKANILKFILFSSDEEKRGIDEIWTTVHRGRYMNIEAKYTLVEVYFNKKDYTMALSVNQELFEEFPTNPACLYMRSKIYETLGEWQLSKETFEMLLEHLNSSIYTTVGYKVECHNGIAQCYFHLREYDKALIHNQRALDLAEHREAKQELEGPLDDFAEILKKTEQLQNKLQDIKR